MGMKGSATHHTRTGQSAPQALVEPLYKVMPGLLISYELATGTTDVFVHRTHAVLLVQHQDMLAKSWCLLAITMRCRHYEPLR